MAGIGPAPKPASKRRNTRTPASWGGAKPTEAAAGSHDPVLGIDGPVHKMVESMWAVAHESAEARFYSSADWERLRFELVYANSILTQGKPITGQQWAAVQHGLNAMLISPAEKRRAAIEVKPQGEDQDAVSATSMMGVYKQKLTAVKTE